MGVVERRARRRRRRRRCSSTRCSTCASPPTCSRRCGGRRRPPSTIDVVVNTHANGDHCYGNELVAGAEIVASRAQRRRDGRGAAVAAGRRSSPPPPTSAAPASTSRRSSAPSPSTASRSSPRPAPSTASSRCGSATATCTCYELGPAHTAGDVAVHVPDAGVVFTGDLVFHGGHPIVWAGPVAALDRRLRPPARPRRRRRRARPRTGRRPRRRSRPQRGYFEWLVAEGTPRLDAAAWRRSTPPATSPAAPTPAGARASASSSTSPRSPATSARQPGRRRRHAVRPDGRAVGAGANATLSRAEPAPRRRGTRRCAR